jgi:hypothetical protein
MASIVRGCSVGVGVRVDVGAGVAVAVAEGTGVALGSQGVAVGFIPRGIEQAAARRTSPATKPTMWLDVCTDLVSGIGDNVTLFGLPRTFDGAALAPDPTSQDL